MITGNTFAFPWEVSLMEWAQTHLGEGGINVISFFSSFGEELFLIILMGFLYWGWNKKLGRAVGLTLLMGLTWNPMIKNIFLRRRPYFDHDGIRLYRLVDGSADQYDIVAQGFSFPSGHSTNAAGLISTLIYGFRKKSFIVLCVLIALLVGLSRVVVGAHYPTDVIFGWLLGFVSFLTVHLLMKHVRRTEVLYGILLLTALPGFFYCRSADYFTAVGMLAGFMAGTLFEEKKVRFENTRSVPRIILRILGGGIIYLALNLGLKAPFSSEFLTDSSLASLFVRAARYAVIAFITFGVYPIAFRYTAGWGLKKA